MWINVVFGLIILIVAWSLIREGLWGATLIFFEVIVAGLIALNFFEPLAGLVQDNLAFLAGYEDGLVLLLLFGLALFILHEADGALWPNMVRFPGLVHRGGAVVFGVLTGLAVSGFLLCAFQTFPVQTDFLGYDSEQQMVMGMGLDRYWLAFGNRMSRKTMGRGADHVFDPQASFIDMYKIRRAAGVTSTGEEGEGEGAGGSDAPGGQAPPGGGTF